MNKRWIHLALSALLLTGIGAGTTSASAAETSTGGKVSLTEAFEDTVIVPYDYQGKVFVRGVKTDIWGDYDIVQKNNRVMVPIRLMGTLADYFGSAYGSWQTDWKAEQPDEVLLRNGAGTRTVKFKVGEKTMWIGQESRTIDVAPQKIDGRIVLPLRSVAEALDTRIEWLDGLIVMGGEPVAAQHPQTISLIAPIKEQLADPRIRPELVDSEKLMIPLTKSGTASYYWGTSYLPDGGAKETLYRQNSGEKEGHIVSLPGNPSLSAAKLSGDELFFLTQTESGTGLYAYDLDKGESRRVADVAKWDPTWGWLEDVRRIDNNLYVNLHYGDLTMGNETLYRLEGGKLVEVASAKSFIDYKLDDSALYAMDFQLMNDMRDNLTRYDRQSGARTVLGEPGYAYGVNRVISEDSVSHATRPSMVVRDQAVYALGYDEQDPKDATAVYRIDGKGRSHTRLTGPADDFWLVGETLYYLDSEDGLLKAAGLQGGASRTVIDKPVRDVRYADGSFYYTIPSSKGAETGILYQYIIASGLLKQRSELPVTEYAVSGSGLYYIQQGYAPGLFKVTADGRNVRLVADNVRTIAASEDGVVYNLMYETGVFAN